MASKTGMVASSKRSRSSPFFPCSGSNAGEVVEVVRWGPASPAGRGGVGGCGPVLELRCQIWRRAAGFSPLAGRGGEGRAWTVALCSRFGGSSANRAGFLAPVLTSSSWCTAAKMGWSVKLLWVEVMAALVSSATSAISWVIKLVFFLLLALLSGYHGGRRRRAEEWLGLRRQLLLILLSLELLYYGFVCWIWLVTRCSAWFGALLLPMLLLAVCKILASTPSGNCGNSKEVDSSRVPCRRLSCCVSSSSPWCSWNCMQQRTALFFVILVDLVQLLILVWVLVIWGQLPRIWMYMYCTVIVG